jgi:hypothetical protein
MDALSICVCKTLSAQWQDGIMARLKHLAWWPGKLVEE